MLSTVGVLSACQTTPVELPDWDSIPAATVECSQPLDATLDFTGTQIAMDDQAIIRLGQYETAFEANRDNLRDACEALRQQAMAYNMLVQSGNMQREIAVIRQELLNQERRNRQIDNWFYRVIILLGAGASL